MKPTKRKIGLDDYLATAKVGSTIDECKAKSGCAGYLLEVKHDGVWRTLVSWRRRTGADFKLFPSPDGRTWIATVFYIEEGASEDEYTRPYWISGGVAKAPVASKPAATSPGTEVVPAVKPSSDFRTRAVEYGWTRDGRAFGVCESGIKRCSFKTPSGKRAKAPATVAAARKLGVPAAPGTWPYDDLQVAWKHTDMMDSHAVHVGAGFIDTGITAYTVKMKGAESSGDSYSLGAIAVSPDGRHVGIIALVLSVDGDHLEARVAEAGVLAARTYNKTGFRLHKAKEYEESAALFRKAHEAHPKWEVAAYNLACALSLKGDHDESRKALTTAVKLGKKKTKKKAKKDPDLDPVRHYPWFKALVR